MLVQHLLSTDHADQPVKGSSLADLHALFHSHALGNSRRLAERMVFALVQILYSFGDQFKDLITLLETTLDRERPLLHFLDGCSDQYLRWRMHQSSKEITNWTESTYCTQELLPQELYVQDRAQSQYYTLPAIETEYVLTVLHSRICLY